MCQGQLNLCNNEKNEKRHVNSLFYTTSCTEQIMYVLLTKHFSYTRVSHNRAHFICNSSQAQLGWFFMYVKITILNLATISPPFPSNLFIFWMGCVVKNKYVCGIQLKAWSIPYLRKQTHSLSTLQQATLFLDIGEACSTQTEHNPVHQQKILLWVWDSAKWVYAVNVTKCICMGKRPFRLQLTYNQQIKRKQDIIFRN